MMARAPNVGVDLGGTKALIVCGDLEQRLLTGSSFSPDDVVRMLTQFLTTHRIQPAGIGIAVPGLVDREGRIAACDVLPALEGWDPRSAFADLQCAVAVMNDVKAALAEEMHDAESGATVGVVMAGTAIGGAFITEGRPLLGASGWAGELGYIPLLVNGRVRRLDELAGGSFMAATLGTSGEELAQRATEGDRNALEATQRGGETLGLGLATVINLLNPSRLAVGGGALVLPGYWDAAQRTAQASALPQLWADCALTTVRAGHRVAALGAMRSLKA